MINKSEILMVRAIGESIGISLNSKKIKFVPRCPVVPKEKLSKEALKKYRKAYDDYLKKLEKVRNNKGK